MGKSKRKKQKRKEKYRLQKERALMANREKVFEGFCFKLESNDYKNIKQLVSPGLFTEVEDYNDVYLIVSDTAYYAWDKQWNDCLTTQGVEFPHPVEDVYGFDKYEPTGLVNAGMAPMQVWRELQENYKPVLGYAIAYLEKLEDKAAIETIREYFRSKERDKNMEILKDYKAGDFLAAEMGGSVILFVYSGVEDKFIAAYNDDWVGLDSEDFINGIDIDDDGIEADWSFIDRSTVRPATPAEMLKFRNVMTVSHLNVVLKENGTIAELRLR